MVIITAACAVAMRPPTMMINSGRRRLCLAGPGTAAMYCPCPFLWGETGGMELADGL
jgi:hypothetical protein